MSKIQLKKILRFMLKRKRKIFLYSVPVVILLIGIFAFIPVLYSKSFAEEQYPGIEIDKTITRSNHLFNPEYVIFSVDNNYDVTAYFIKLGRKNLIKWQVIDVSYKKVTTPAYLSEDELNKTSKESLDSLYASVQAGNLTQGDNINYGNVLGASTDNIQSAKQEEIKSITDQKGEHTAELILVGGKETILKVDGQQVSNLKNLASPMFSTDGKYIYYTKFKPIIEDESHGDDSSYSGKIYRVDINTFSDELIYEFGEEHWMNLAANEDVVVYTLDNGETGVISLETKEKKVIQTFDMFPESDPSEIVYMDEKVVVIVPNDKEKLASGKTRQVEIDLEKINW